MTPTVVEVSPGRWFFVSTTRAIRSFKAFDQAAGPGEDATPSASSQTSRLGRSDAG